MIIPRAAIQQYTLAAWPWLLRLFTLAIITVVGVLVFKMGSRINWRDVIHASAQIDKTTLAVSGGLVCAGYATYASIEYLSRQVVNHSVAIWKTLVVAVVSYAINLNLGVLLGGIGVRLRLYRKLGLDNTTAAEIVLFSSLTNWLGYFWLAGTVFVIGAVPAPDKWGVSRATVQLVGFGLLAVATAYVVACAASRKRSWTWRKHRIMLASVWMALAQSAVAIVSWSIMGAIVYILLERQIPYGEVLSILLFCSIAAIIAHIPGGLGVTEAIFVAALAGRMPDHQVLAALLMYRVLYQLIPLCAAAPAYFAIEYLTSHRTA
ncbi:lysylphosphatidylglycerol synthase domain-containing protein [Eoetvoesiella caeni]